MSQHIAVIGAGVAGLACARRLMDAGAAVAVFEKSRGLGGRCATRRVDNLAFDHGAQYATARTDAFRDYLAAAEAAGQAARWTAAEDLRGDGYARYVGVPGMSALVTGLAAGIDVRTKTEVTSLLRTATGWALGLNTGDAEGAYAAVVLALPAPQALTLVPKHHFAPDLAKVSFAPCWSGLVAFAEPIDAPDLIDRNGPIFWAARDETKPGRDAVADCWVLHANAEWSRKNLEERPEDIAPALGDAFATARGGALPETVHMSAHRWRYALVEQPLGQDYLWDEESRLGLCGDWCLGPRIEEAFTSGDGLGARIAGTA
jgi:predicted NAD/FAD-dependent oxidoreductase